jgi:protein-tyrosine phosphatase
MPAPTRLLVVCLGNICRSPMAEGALRARLAQAGLEDAVQVDSAGTGDWHVGAAPDRRAIACAARNGVAISGQRARQLAAGDFAVFDAILCADHATLRETRARSPAALRERCMLLSAYARRGEVEIPDPYTGSAADFDHAWNLVDAMARDIVQGLQQSQRPKRSD